MENYPTSTEEDQGTETIRRSVGDTNVAQSILVPNGPKDETSCKTNNMAGKQKMVLSRMKIIHKHRQKFGLNNTTTSFLGKKTRESTNRAYDRGWKQWVEWCKKQKRNPEEYNTVNVLSFLRGNDNYSKTHPNGLHSAIASVFAVIHKDKRPIADNTMIKDFFIAKKKSEAKIPTHHQLFTWDLTILLKHTKETMLQSDQLSLQQLQIKTILLLCMATMWRPRSDIGRLQYQGAQIKEEGPIYSVTTLFQAHSIRAAASTKAVELANSIQSVKKHANWSLKSNTFEKYYFKPSSQRSSTAIINNSIFSSTENSITLEAGVESTGISLGTTINTNVDETKASNVIHAL